MSKLFEEMMEGLQEARAFMEGKETGCRVHIPSEIDVRRIRGKLHMSQQQFAGAFGFSVDAVRHWESGRRCPEAAARSLLMVIDHDAEMVQRALSRAESKQASQPKAEQGKPIRRKAGLAKARRPARTPETVHATA